MNCVATVSRTGPNRVSVIHDDFPAEMETLHAFGYRRIWAAQRNRKSTEAAFTLQPSPQQVGGGLSARAAFDFSKLGSC